jgi:hypothetical protein
VRELPLVDCRYDLANRYHEPIRTRFAVGIDLNLDSSNHKECFLETAGGRKIALDQAGEIVDLSEISLVDQTRGYRITLSPRTPATLWHFPLESISRSPLGIAAVFQGTALYFWWPLELWGNEKKRFEIALSLEA